MVSGQPRGHVLGFFGVGVVGAHHRNVTVVLRGHDAGRTVLEQRARHLDDVRGRTMIAREVEHHGVGPGTHDLLEELGIGAVEAVNGLVGSPTQNRSGSSPAICRSSKNCNGFMSWASST